jgi:hypothetical protein
MKKIGLFVFILIASSAFAQNFKINNSSGDVLYVDGGSNIGIAVEGYESSKVIATASILGILEGENGRYFVNLENSKMGRAKVGDKVEISVCVEKEDGNYLVGSKTFEVKRKSDFEMRIGNFKTGDKVTATDIDAMENMEVYSKSFAANNEFKVVSFSTFIVPKEGPAEAIFGESSKISPTMKIHFKKWQDGSRILIDDIVLENAKGERKLGSRMMLIFTEGSGVYVSAFENKEFFTKEELLALGPLDAIAKSNGEIYLIKGYNLLIVRKSGLAEAFSTSSNQLTENIKDSIERAVKPGDKILLDDIIYQKPDGTEGRCAPVRIFIL